MLVVGNETTTTLGLLLVEEDTRHTEVCDLDHEIVQCLVILAIEALFGIGIHDDVNRLICCNAIFLIDLTYC